MKPATRRELDDLRFRIDRLEGQLKEILNKVSGMVTMLDETFKKPRKKRSTRTETT